jgi:hypothetical protein
MSGVANNYLLSIKFGDKDMSINSSIIQECTIVQDIRKFLPEFRFVIKDTSGLLSHVVPFDKKMSRVSFKLANNVDSNKMDFYDFLVYRRELLSEGTINGDYDIRGMLNIDNLHSPKYIRSFNSSVDSVIRLVGAELGITNFEISSSLDIKKTIIQPNWTNAQLLRYLSETVEGNNGESNYRVFIKVKENAKILVFKSLRELITSTVKVKHIVSDKAFEDYKASYGDSILDNYRYLGILGCRKQTFTYFNYDTGTFTKKEKDLSKVVGLSEHHLIDKSDPEEGLVYNNTGRTNIYNGTFDASINSLFESRVLDLVKMWLTAPGDLTIKQGDVIRVLFPQGFSTGKLFSYQYAGYWLVERVVYHLSDTFTMSLLLTRNGLELRKKTSLVPATLVKR